MECLRLLQWSRCIRAQIDSRFDCCRRCRRDHMARRLLRSTQGALSVHERLLRNCSLIPHHASINSFTPCSCLRPAAFIRNDRHEKRATIEMRSKSDVPDEAHNKEILGPLLLRSDFQFHRSPFSADAIGNCSCTARCLLCGYGDDFALRLASRFARLLSGPA